jgi:hypothetical protein
MMGKIEVESDPTRAAFGATIDGAEEAERQAVAARSLSRGRPAWWNGPTQSTSLPKLLYWRRENDLMARALAVASIG